MKKLSVVFVFIALIAFAGSAYAQATKIAVFNLSYAVTNSNAGKKAQEDLNAFELDRMNRISPLRDEIMKLESDYMAQEKVLTETAKKNKMSEIERKYNEYNTLANSYATEIQQKNDEYTNRIMREIESVVVAIANEKGITTVFQAQAVVYSKDTEDITNEVIQRYNSQNAQ